MATIELYSCSKRLNSTSLPKERTGLPPDYDYNEWVCTLSGEFQMPFDVIRPVVVFNELDRTQTSYGETFENNPPNYAVWIPSQLGESIYRYYWITNIVWLSDSLVEVHLEEDYLATWQDYIYGSTQYVLRSSASFDGDINDTWYPIESSIFSYVHNISSSIPWYMATPSLNAGYYIIGIINDATTAYGAVSYYLFPHESFEWLRHELLTDVTWTNMSFSEISQELYQSLFNPMQYIVSCKWFPIAPSYDAVGDKQATINIGWWKNISLGLNVCYPLKNFISTDSFSLSIDNHPSAATRGSYLNTPPYRRRSLYIEPFGSIELNTSILINPLNAPTLTWYVDFVTGKAVVRVTNYLGALAGQGEAMIGVDINIAQSTQDIVGAASGLLSSGLGVGQSIAGFATGNISAGISGIAGAAGGIANAASAMLPTVTSQGTNGSLIAFGIPMLDVTYYNNVADEDNADFGRPLCRSVKLSTLKPGFVKCMNPHIIGDLINTTERQAIERALADGVFLEDKGDR